MSRFHLIALLLVFAAQAGADEVRIFRDAWGVPRIVADTPAGAMYGFGYAQAEDRLEALLKNYLIATGRQAEVFGPEYVDADFQQRLIHREAIAPDREADIAPDVRALIDAFVKGIRAFMRDRPDRVPRWAFDPTPQHVIALGYYLACQTLEKQARSEYTGHPIPLDTGNQWVLSARRSAEDAVVLCMDPFARWHDTFRSYEAHLHGGDLNAFGFAVPGLPVFQVGHNRTLGWSALPGGADGADVYEIDLDSPIANRYRCDDAWQPIATDTVRIGVRIGDRIEYRTRRYQRTHWGPILYRKDTRAYVFRFALSGQARQIEEYYRMMTAPDQKAFYAALNLEQTAPQRIVYGDAYGNIACFLTGRVPVRSEFYAWNRPVPGNTTETDWQGVHTQDTLPQLFNPQAGWIQDCDASPDRITDRAMLIGPQHPAYTFSYLPPEESPRSFRMRTLLGAALRPTLDEAVAFSQDTYVIHAERWLRALNIAAAGVRDSLTRAALDELNAWNGRADRDVAGIALYARWRERCRQKGRDIDDAIILSSQPMGETTARLLVRSLDEAAADLQNTYGRLGVYWKEIQRYRRNDQSWPLAGLSDATDTCLRAVRTEPNGPLRDGVFGPACTTVVCFRAPGKIEAYSAVPFGQSDDPSSPHDTDQAAQFFSQERLKPTQFDAPTKQFTLEHTLHMP